MNKKNQNTVKRVTSEDFYRISASSFRGIPGSPISYWASKGLLRAFKESPGLSSFYKPAVGLQTGDNTRFLRYWFEVSKRTIGFNMPNRASAHDSNRKWFPYNKGGDFRRWYGNQEFIVNWENDGEAIRSFTNSAGRLRSRPQNLDTYFKPSISWSKISSGLPAFRYFPAGFIYDVAGTSVFADDLTPLKSIGMYCNSILVQKFLEVLSPTLNFEVGHIAKLPVKKNTVSTDIFDRLIEISKSDWDSFETSWNFSTSPVLMEANVDVPIRDSYDALRKKWRKMTEEMKALEVVNNQIFLEAFDLSEEFKADVPLDEITLECNPAFRYQRQGNRTAEEIESQLLADTVKDFISYAVGCMLGRYSIDEPGLILASQGETVEDYLKRVPEPTFYPTENNVIPIVGGGWFADDITEQFRRFLKVTFGEEHYEENLEFIEKALNTKNRRQYNIEDYFLKEFYTDHVTRYQKRPIYWLFSSPKGSFNALIYMHRYNADTISILLNEYLREFQTKLLARKASLELISTSARDSNSRTQAMNELEETNKILSELNDYERDIIFPLATEKIEIDLDDGVKANYPKFGRALKKVAGL